MFGISLLAFENLIKLKEKLIILLFTTTLFHNEDKNMWDEN